VLLTEAGEPIAPASIVSERASFKQLNLKKKSGRLQVQLKTCAW
jgi:hypothetical protein